MEGLSYLVGNPKPEFAHLQKNYDAFNVFMSNFQLSGLFSDRLIQRVYGLSWNALYSIVDVEKTHTSFDTLEFLLNSLISELETLFNTYNIFSEEFSNISINLFKEICSLDTLKKKINKNGKQN